MSEEKHKMAQDGQDERQDEARWRQDAKIEGCLERFGPSWGHLGEQLGASLRPILIHLIPISTHLERHDEAT